MLRSDRCPTRPYPGAMAKKQRGQRVAQIRAAYRATRRVDPKVGLYTALAGIGAFAVVLVTGVLLGHPYYAAFLGVMVGLLAATVVFGRRVQGAAYAQAEGQPGAAAWALEQLTRGWSVTPAVAVSRSQDVVHRAVGRGGIVLVGEGSPARLGNLLAQERKRLNRVAPDAPVTDIQVGEGEGQVPLRNLQRHVMKLPKKLHPSEVTELERRLRALGTTNIPIPKGPLPKGMRMPRAPQR